MDDIDQYDSRLDNVVQETVRAEPPDALYHYTTWEGAEAILTSRQFRFTSHDCTNDDAELTSADHVVVDVAGRLRAQVGQTEAILLDLLLDNYAAMKAKLGPVYLACFSQARDMGSQWEEYADGGQGLCLGIQVLKHESMPENQGLGVFLLRVDYSETSWRDRVMLGLTVVCDERARFQSKNERESRRAIDLALNAMYRIASLAAITAKKAKWADEREWRQVAFARKGAVVTPSESTWGGKTKRYVQLAVRNGGKPLALEEIIVGPRQDFGLAKSRLQQILERSGYPQGDTLLPQVVAAQSR